MKTKCSPALLRRLCWLPLFLLIVVAGLPLAARAGLVMEMNVIRYHQYGYYFYPNLNTNTIGSPAPSGDYLVTSPGYPTNGSWAMYRFDTNGFSGQGGGNYGYGDFAGMMTELTNRLWSIYVTNNTSTNLYRFKVTANISSNDLPYVNITFPADGAVNVTNQPTYTWSGPTNYGNLVVYAFNDSAVLPVTQTSWLSAQTLYKGPNSFTAHYDSNSATAVVCSVPTNTLAQPISSWVSTNHLQDYATANFTVGVFDPSGTAHSLMARFNWDTTNNVGGANGTDTSGNGNDLNFGGSYGDAGGSSSSTDSAAGARAIRFHDGDTGSGGYVGWNPTPSSLLQTLAGSFSISCWIKTSQNNFGWNEAPAFYGAGILAADVSGTDYDAVPLAITGSRIGFNTGGSEDVTLNSATDVTDNVYHHIVVTRNRVTGQKVIYIDGVMDRFGSGSTNLLNAPQLLTLGSLANAEEPDAPFANYHNGYDGLLDDLQVYSGVLSSNEVAQLYGNPGTTVGNGGSFTATLNDPNLNWSTGGDLPWFVQTTNTHDSISAAQSGAITDDQESWIETTVTGPGTLNFWWQVSSEDGYDYLELAMDGNFQLDTTGDPGWAFVTLNIPTGPHTLRWRYYKDGCCLDYLDAAFLDEVSFVPFTPTPGPELTANPFNQTNYPGYQAALFAAVTNTDVTWQWFKVGNPSPIANATNGLYIPTNSGTAGVAGSYYAIVTNVFGAATTTVATVTFQSAALPPDWSAAFRTQLYGVDETPTTNINLACLLDVTGTNIFTVGTLRGTNQFGTNVLISAFNREGCTFLKQTLDGTPVWGRCMTNNGNGTSFPRALAPAPGNGIYVLGFFLGTNWLGTNRLVDTAGGSTFLVRLNDSGNDVWVRTITGTNFNFPVHHGLVADPAGNVTLSTLISGQTQIGATNQFVQGQQGVLVQFDANGTPRWLQVPSAWPDYLTYSNGRIYGSMGGTETNIVGGLSLESDRRRMLFALNATNGQGIWIRGFSTDRSQPGGTFFGDNNALVTVSGNDLFVLGSGYGTNATFGAFSVDIPGRIGGYFARYDLNGNAQLATTFGGRQLWPWAAVSDVYGNVYMGADFDTYATFGSKVLGAPFNETVQTAGNIEIRLPGQLLLAKFDRNGNPLWARMGVSPTSYANTRDITLAPDGVWSCGFFNPTATFGAINVSGILTCVGTPFCTPQAHQSGYLAKITDSLLLLNPQTAGNAFQFQFQSQSGASHAVQYRTNLIGGLNWQTYSNVAGDGSLKTIAVPRSVFSPSSQGFIRISTP